MTLLGKVLVFFVLLFSMITGGLMVMVYLRSTDWKKAHDDLTVQTSALKAAVEAEKEMGRKERQDRDATIEQQKQDKAELVKTITGKESEVANLRTQLTQQISTATSENANNNAATAEILKLQNQRALDQNILNERNGYIVKLEKSNVDFRNRQVQAEIEKNAAVERNQNLALKVEQLSRENASLKASGAVADAKKRPPAVEVKGEVKEVAGSFARISLGKDHGLTKGDELQVYRLAPNPTWLGTLRVDTLQDHQSVGIFTPANRNAKIMTGDTVDTKISR